MLYITTLLKMSTFHSNYSCQARKMFTRYNGRKMTRPTSNNIKRKIITSSHNTLQMSSNQIHSILATRPPSGAWPKEKDLQGPTPCSYSGASPCPLPTVSTVPHSCHSIYTKTLIHPLLQLFHIFCTTQAPDKHTAVYSHSFTLHHNPFSRLIPFLTSVFVLTLRF